MQKLNASIKKKYKNCKDKPRRVPMSLRFATVLTVLSFIFFSQSAFSQTNPAQKEWTFLVYINGHNNLSSFGDMNIIDMEKVGSSNDVNVVVEWGSMKPINVDPTTGQPESYQSISKRLYIEKSQDPTKVNSQVLQEFDLYDMGSYQNLQSFIKWGVQNYPAKHYFIAVWNHGAGWQRSKSSNQVNDISFDDNTGNLITTEQMGTVMSYAKTLIGHNVDIYGSDACLMQMMEVAGELKDSVDYVVGSQETEPGEGWPYYPFLKSWTENPTLTPIQVSTLLSKEYLKAYSVGGVYYNPQSTYHSPVTLSVLDMSQIGGIYSAVDHFQKKITQLSSADFLKVRSAAKKSVSFSRYDYVDLGNFSLNVSKLNLAGLDSQLFSDIDAGLKKFVVTSDNSASKFSQATGLSVWIPLIKYYKPGSQDYDDEVQKYKKSYKRYELLKSSLGSQWHKFNQKIISTY